MVKANDGLRHNLNINDKIMILDGLYMLFKHLTI